MSKGLPNSRLTLWTLWWPTWRRKRNLRLHYIVTERNRIYRPNAYFQGTSLVPSPLLAPPTPNPNNPYSSDNFHDICIQPRLSKARQLNISFDIWSHDLKDDNFACNYKLINLLTCLFCKTWRFKQPKSPSSTPPRSSLKSSSVKHIQRRQHHSYDQIASQSQEPHSAWMDRTTFTPFGLKCWIPLRNFRKTLIWLQPRRV